MQSQYPEIIVVIIAGSLLALLLVGFIVTMLIVYRRRQFKQEQELLNARLEIQEQILKNLSEEIHDNIGQMLSVLKLTLAAIPNRNDSETDNFIKESKGMVNMIISSVSDLSKSLHTDRILKIGILDAVGFELEKIEKTNLFTTSFNGDDNTFKLEPENEIFLFRIIQEILNNILKHSKANHIEVRFFCKERFIVFTFADNGVGFDVKEALQKSAANRGIGLTSMTNRAKLIGGQLNISSQPGKGTIITIEIPAVVIAPGPQNLKKISADAKEVQNSNSR